MSLVVLQSQLTVLEPNAGDVATVTACFSAEISTSLDRDAIFDFNVSLNSTAEVFIDYFILGGLSFFNLSLIIPAGFSGSFSTCIDVIILGDGEPETSEMAAFEITPRLECDQVLFPPDSPNLLILTIFDADGELDIM